jgi:CRISPR system Cascade subunit CasE
VIYLSCLEIDVEQQAARRWLADPYRIHQRLHKAFPDRTEFLYRVEERHDTPRILVQAPLEADWEAAFSDLRILASIRQKQVSFALEQGQTLRFLLRANPTRRLPGGGVVDPVTGKPKDGARVGLFREEQQRDWLNRRAEAGGFRPLAYDIRPLGTLSFTRPRDGRRLQFLGVEFEGHLQVVDPEGFREVVEQGIGSGKGFGFGLLSLAPGC